MRCRIKDLSYYNLKKLNLILILLFGAYIKQIAVDLLYVSDCGNMADMEEEEPGDSYYTLYTMYIYGARFLMGLMLNGQLKANICFNC